MDNIQTVDTEAKILAAAEQIFVRDGYDGARMQAIAEAAGINKAMLHYYFRSKEKLFEKILQERIIAFLPELNAAFHSRMTVEERIEAFVDAYLHMLTANPQLPLFVLYSLYRNPSFADRIPRVMFDMITTYFQEEINAGRIKPVDPSQFLLSILSMCIFPYVARPIACHMMGKDHHAYDALLAQRKPEIMKLIKAMLVP
jgi:AcrR family transcriptional regulator